MPRNKPTLMFPETLADQEPPATDQDSDAERYTAIVDRIFAELDTNIAAWHTDEGLKALAYFYEYDRPEWIRLIEKFKKWQIGGKVERGVLSFFRKEIKAKKDTLPTLSTLARLSEGYIQHQSSTKQYIPALKEDSLVCFDDDGKPTLKIESAAAVILADALKGVVAYSQQAQTWHAFTGTHWAPQRESFIDTTLIKLFYAGTASLGFRNAYKNNVRAILADGGFLPLPDGKDNFLPFQNGLLDTRTGNLDTITPENALTWCLPYDYDESADCPTIKSWLLSAVDGDEETMEFLRAWLAALLHGRSDLQKFLHLIGSGGTGKGVFMRLATELVGKRNTVSTTLREMEQNRFETARFYGARLVTITDSDRYGGSVNTLKALTGQDHLRLEKKHQQQSGGFMYEGMVAMASNENLTTTDHTSGIDRRRLTVIFDRRVSDEEKQAWETIGGEKVVLHREIAGLANWVLALTQDDIGRIFRNPPKRVRDANFDAMTAGNPLAEWLVNHCIPDREAWTQIGECRKIQESGSETDYENSNVWLYANYLKWSQRHNRMPCSVRRFREIIIQTLKTFKIHVREARRATGMGICGIRLRKEWESVFPDWIEASH